MFEELLISVLFIIVLIILCIISNLYSKKKEEKEKYIMLRNSIKEDLKENFISEEEYWQYNKEYSDKIKKIKEDIQLYEEEKETETIKNKIFLISFIFSMLVSLARTTLSIPNFSSSLTL